MTTKLPKGWEADGSLRSALGDHGASEKKQETTFKTALDPEIAEVIGEDARGGTAVANIQTIEQADMELGLSPSGTKKKGLFSRFRGTSRKFDKSGKPRRSSSVPPRRRGSSGGVGELASKPSPSNSAGGTDLFGTSPRTSSGSVGGDNTFPAFENDYPPPAPNYAQKNDTNETLTFKPPSVPSMADEDDFKDFVLEVKCLDTGKTEVVKSDTNGLAGISWEERKRIRGSIVLGEKLLMDKIASFKAGVNEKRQSLKSSMSRKSSWGGRGNKKSDSLGGGGGAGGITSRASTGGGTVSGGGSKWVGDKKKRIGEIGDNNKKELTFALRSTPYSASDGGMAE